MLRHWEELIIMLKIYNVLKRLIFTNLSLIRLSSYKSKPVVNGFTIFNKNTCIGENCSFNGFRVYGSGYLTIGDNFHSGKGCFVITQVHNYEGTKLPYDETFQLKNITIGDNVWLGMNVSILSNCNIGEGAIIQAGSVVISDIPPHSIAGGNPARVFKSRNVEHYVRLKKSQSFH